MVENNEPEMLSIKIEDSPVQDKLVKTQKTTSDGSDIDNSEYERQDISDTQEYSNSGSIQKYELNGNIHQEIERRGDTGKKENLNKESDSMKHKQKNRDSNKQNTAVISEGNINQINDSTYDSLPVSEKEKTEKSKTKLKNSPDTMKVGQKDEKRKIKLKNSSDTLNDKEENLNVKKNPKNGSDKMEDKEKIEQYHKTNSKTDKDINLNAENTDMDGRSENFTKNGGIVSPRNMSFSCYQKSCIYKKTHILYNSRMSKTVVNLSTNKYNKPPRRIQKHSPRLKKTKKSTFTSKLSSIFSAFSLRSRIKAKSQKTQIIFDPQTNTFKYLNFRGDVLTLEQLKQEKGRVAQLIKHYENIYKLNHTY